MVADEQDVIDRLLSAFTGADGSVHPSLEPWVERLRAGQPTILPSTDADGTLHLYGISRSRPAARGLAEELLAAIGPSWSDFEGAPAVLDPADRREAALLAFQSDLSSGPVLKATVRDKPAAWSAMKRLKQAWDGRPEGRREVLEPLSEVLRDVELAIQTSSIAEAERLLIVLRERGELSSQNLLFIELRLLAAAGRWSEVLRHPRVDDVVNARRPARVSAMLFEALHAVYFAGAASRGDASMALASFKETVRDRFAPLLASGPELDSVGAVQLRILELVSREGSREDARALVELATPADRQWLNRLADLATEAKPTVEPNAGDTAQLIATAREAGYSKDHRRVLGILEAAPPSIEIVELLLGAAVAIRSLTAARQVVLAFEQLNSEAQETLLALPLLGGPLRDILTLGGAGDAIVDSWDRWLKRLAEDADFPNALEIAELGSVEWNPAEPENAERAASLALALTSIPDVGRPTLERALPHLLAYLARRPSLDDLSTPVYAAILEVLAYGESRSRAVREAATAVLNRLLEATPTAADYEGIVELAGHIWREDGLRSPKALSWFVDVLQILVDHPCPSAAVRADLVREALADAASWREIDSVDLELLSLLATDQVFAGRFNGEVEALATTHGAADETEAPADSATREVGELLIGIYTLSEQAAIRAKTILLRRYPKVTIELNHEHDGSDRLRSLSRRADIMAMVIASAQHAATDAIRRSVTGEALLEVGTAGSTGLVRAVLGRLQELSAA